MPDQDDHDVKQWQHKRRLLVSEDGAPGVWYANLSIIAGSQ